MAALGNLTTQLSTSFATLTRRERVMVISAAAAVVLFAAFLVSFNISRRGEAIRRTTEQKVARLEEVQVLAANYGQKRAEQQAVEAQLQASNVRLITYLEEKARAAGLELPSINPRADVSMENSKIVESAVELTLNDVKLNRLVDFITSVEAGPGVVKVKYLRLEPRVASESITAWLTVATYRVK